VDTIIGSYVGFWRILTLMIQPPRFCEHALKCTRDCCSFVPRVREMFILAETYDGNRILFVFDPSSELACWDITDSAFLFSAHKPYADVALLCDPHISLRVSEAMKMAQLFDLYLSKSLVRRSEHI